MVFKVCQVGTMPFGGLTDMYVLQVGLDGCLACHLLLFYCGMQACHCVCPTSVLVLVVQQAAVYS
jgi:hypothetical protein